VAVDLIKDIRSFDPLARALSSSDQALRQTAERALYHLTGALLVNSTYYGAKLVGEGAPPWAELFEHLVKQLRSTTVYPIRPVVLALCDKPELMTKDQSHFAGMLARRLLEFALLQEGGVRDAWLVTAGIEAVCRTFESNPTQSAVVLRQCLEPSHLAACGYEEMFKFGHELERLIPLAPELVKELFRTAFTFREYRNERRIVGSRIVGLASTPQQDYDLARYLFAGRFKKFLESAPTHATRALIATIEAYDGERFMSQLKEGAVEETFDFNGRMAKIKADYSAAWDGGYSSDDKQLQMLNTFQEYLLLISKSTNRIDEVRKIVNIFVDDGHAAILWRRLLKCGAYAPHTLGYELRHLGWAMPILLSYDTTLVAGEFLSAIFSFLSREERERVERAILSIPHVIKEGNKGSLLSIRDRLLGCLPFDELITEEAGTLIKNLSASHSSPTPSPETVYDMTPTDSAQNFSAGREGVAGDGHSSRIKLLCKAVETFIETYRNDVPPGEHVKKMMPDFRSLYQELEATARRRDYSRYYELAIDHLANSLKIAARCDDLMCDAEDGVFLKSTLLEISEYPEPVHNPQHDSFFDEHPSWFKPAPRVDAAEGLMSLARHAVCVDEELLKAIERLSRDTVPAVRFVVSSNLLSLYESAPEVMWRLIERVCYEEPRRGVLRGILNPPLRRLAGKYADRVVSLVRTIFMRVREGSGAAEVRKRCASILNSLYLWQNNSVAYDLITGIANNPADNVPEAYQILLDLRSILNLGPVNPPNAEQDATRQRGFKFVKHLVRQTYDQLQALEEKNKDIPFNAWPHEEQENGSELARVADAICMEIYFASGAYKDDNATGLKINPGADERLRFLQEAEGIFDVLCELGYVKLTHHLLETFEYLISFDPAKVFLLVGRAVRSGKRDFYQYEPLAIDLIVSMVERFIAEFRYVLKENEACRDTLIEILDTFVDAGWPSARRVAYHLEDIFQ
jgi:hypothetical protein